MMFSVQLEINQRSSKKVKGYQIVQSDFYNHWQTLEDFHTKNTVGYIFLNKLKKFHWTCQFTRAFYKFQNVALGGILEVFMNISVHKNGP